MSLTHLIVIPLDPRKGQILSAIIQHFTETAEPVGSKTVLVRYQLSVSPATIRNDMSFLENEGLIYQPHTSSGRVPTNKGYRVYIDQLVDYEKAQSLAKEHLKNIRRSLARKKVEYKIHEAVSLLSQAVPHVSFASLPDNERTFYLGISNMLKEPEFMEQPLQASQVIEVLEEKTHFLKTLDQLNIGEEPQIFIGKENILPQIESCSLLVCRYRLEEYNGYLGLLGPTRMAYGFNIALLREIQKLIHD